ncbi:hypothetical protein HDU97_008933 [Phlyctochytrium planicorne]|nr:hypothetical protein HDU97_008933 [Phlyctochytrium planicorne]
MAPIEIIRHILWWAEDYSVAIKFESILLGIPATLPDRSMAFDSFELSDFPISALLAQKFRLFPHDVDASTVSLSVIAWLCRFQPEIFLRRKASLVNSLVWHGKLEAIKLIRACNIPEAFEHIEISSAMARGQDFVRYLHETIGIQVPEGALYAAAGTGNLALFQYLESVGAERIGPVVQSAFDSGNANLLRHVLENGYTLDVGSPHFHCSNTIRSDHVYPELQDLILSTHPSLMRNSILKAVGEGNLDLLRHFTKELGLALPDYCISAAASSGNLDVLTFIVEDLGMTAFIGDAVQTAAKCGKLEALKYLLNKTPEPLLVQERKTALGYACLENQLAVVKYLHETDPNSCINISGEDTRKHMVLCIDSLQCAAARGALGCLAYLNDACRHKDVRHTLPTAAGGGYLEAVKFLVPMASAEDLETAFSLACSRQQLEVAKFLHARGLQGSHEDLLRHADYLPLDLVKFLYENGLFDFTEATLNVVAMRGRLELAKFMVSKKPETVTAWACSSALHFAHFHLYSFLYRHLSLKERNALPSCFRPYDVYVGCNIRPLLYRLSWHPQLEIDEGILRRMGETTSEFGDSPEFDGEDLLEFLAEHHMGLSPDAIARCARENEFLDTIRTLKKLGLIDDNDET